MKMSEIEQGRHDFIKGITCLIEILIENGFNSKLKETCRFLESMGFNYCIKSAKDRYSKEVRLIVDIW